MESVIEGGDGESGRGGWRVRQGGEWRVRRKGVESEIEGGAESGAEWGRGGWRVRQRGDGE